jgi:phosphoglucosamine mutase
MNGGLTDLTKGLKDYPQIIVNVKVRSKPPLDTLPEVSRALSDAHSALGHRGRIVLRYSGTEPLARVMVEAEHDADVQRFSQSLANAVRASIGA